MSANPKTRAAQRYLTAADVEAFHARFVTLRRLAALLGLSWQALNVQLGEAGIAPATPDGQTIPDWTSWIINWLAEDQDARDAILIRDGRAVLGATGNKKDGPLTADAIRNLEPGILAWLRGEPMREIERQLGGDPAENAICPRARELVSQLVPLSLSFAAGLVARTASEISAVADGTATPVSAIDCLAAGVRRGFDTPNKLAFSDIKRGFLSRVQTHQAYSATIGREPEISNMEEYPAVVDRMRVFLLLIDD